MPRLGVKTRARLRAWVSFSGMNQERAQRTFPRGFGSETGNEKVDGWAANEARARTADRPTATVPLPPSDAARRSLHDDLRRSCHSVRPRPRASVRPSIRSQEILREEGAANGIGLKNRETEIGRREGERDGTDAIRKLVFALISLTRPSDVADVFDGCPSNVSMGVSLF